MRPEVLDCVVVGGGPAGLTAGLYLHRFHRSLRIVDAGGARALRISCSNNVAGFPDGISGAQLLERMKRHLHRVGGAVVQDRVQRLARNGDGLFSIALGQARLLSRTVLVCTGVRDRLPALRGAGIVEAADLLRYCPICDGYEHTGKRIGVLGHSAHGVREAAFLKQFSPQVAFIGVGGWDEALDPDLQAAGVEALPGKPARLAVAPGGGAVVKMDDGSEHFFDVLYAALGVDPCAELVAPLGAQCDEIGNIVVDSHGQTSVDGLYAAGDVVRALDQIGVAVGQAAIAATAIHNRL